MILNSTKFGGNRTKYVEVGPDRRTNGQPDRQADSICPPNYACGGIIICLMGLTDHLKIGLVCRFKMKYVHLVSTEYKGHFIVKNLINEKNIVLRTFGCIHLCLSALFVLIVKLSAFYLSLEINTYKRTDKYLSWFYALPNKRETTVKLLLLNNF
jgi:hypothetical protein